MFGLSGTLDNQGRAVIADTIQVQCHVISVEQNLLAMWHQLLCRALAVIGNYIHN